VSNTTFLNRTNWIIVRDPYIGTKHDAKKLYASIVEIVGDKIWNVELGQKLIIWHLGVSTIYDILWQSTIQEENVEVGGKVVA
jgi:hypothetical protein